MRKVAGLFVLGIVLLFGAVFLFGALGAGVPTSGRDMLQLAFGLLVAMAVLYAVARIAMRLLRPEPPLAKADLAPRADRRPPIPPVPDSELADLPEPVSACPDCGFLGIRMLSLQDGAIPGGSELGDKMTCPRCGYQGLAVRFDKRADYGEFLRDLNTTA